MIAIFIVRMFAQFGSQATLYYIIWEQKWFPRLGVFNNVPLPPCRGKVDTPTSVWGETKEGKVDTRTCLPCEQNNSRLRAVGAEHPHLPLPLGRGNTTPFGVGGAEHSPPPGGGWDKRAGETKRWLNSSFSAHGQLTATLNALESFNAAMSVRCCGVERMQYKLRIRQCCLDRLPHLNHVISMQSTDYMLQQRTSEATRVAKERRKRQ